jgi:hypothetical protein
MNEPWWERRETDLAQSAVEDLPALALADAASRLLGGIIYRAGFEAPESDPPPASYWQSRALLYLGLLAARSSRTIMLLLRHGYEAEAASVKRLLWECHSRARAVIDDESDQYARTWLEGRSGKAAKAVGKYGAPAGMWDFLSRSAHADPRAVENWLAISEADGSTRLVLLPERRPETANATLTMAASEARDIAVLISKARDIALPDISALDAALADSLSRWLPEGGAADNVGGIAEPPAAEPER